MPKLKVGLALGGGGAKGFAHLGVIKALHNHQDIEIVQIAGTSMGSLIACGYASKGTYELLEQSILQKQYLSFIKSFFGLIKFDYKKLHTFCDEFVEMAHFSDLVIPTKVIATDLKQMKSVVLDSGNVAIAVTASSLTPYIHKPYKYKDFDLVDGGITNLLPIEHADSKDVDVILGVDVSSSDSYHVSDITFHKKRHLIDLNKITCLFKYSNLVAQNEIVELKKQYIKKPVFILKPSLEDISNIQFSKAKEAIHAGEEITKLKIDEIASMK